eukprot:TRINITY_DN13003_c0_g1_i1.p1 TRINITY_DN13003_c0_g1~~TRINITY_DN13003_c0_g1_i1.p1  ORF type:complete len:421 (-),score=53.81 TRINITY_DN13003_c0_g1_i1:105-1367(-)
MELLYKFDAYHPPPSSPGFESLSQWEPPKDFGKAFLPHFAFDKHICFLNNGSYGANPLVVRSERLKWLYYADSQPLRYYNYDLLSAMTYTIRVLSEFVGAAPEDVVLVQNATMGVNCVVRSLKLKPTDNIVALNLGYAAINNCIRYACQYAGAEARLLEIQIPVNFKKLLETLDKAIDSNTKLVVIDHITSSTGLIIPISAVIDLCHAKNVEILVDGAHSVGHIPIHLDKLGADYYTSNCHKWVYSSMGSAFLWVDKKHQSKIHPTVISHGYGHGYNSEFLFSGTKDYTAYLTIPTAINFYNKIGGEKIRNHNHQLAVWAGLELKKRWNTNFVFEETNEYHLDNVIGNLCTVELPASMDRPATVADGNALHDKLLFEYGIEVPVVVLDQKLHIRISTQIWNEKQEYLKLADSICSIYGDN